jgi:hypothetical protein
MSGQIPTFALAGDDGGDNRWAVPVSNIILDHQNGSDSALLGTDHWRKVGIVDVPSPDGPWLLYDHLFFL